MRSSRWETYVPQPSHPRSHLTHILACRHIPRPAPSALPKRPHHAVSLDPLDDHCAPLPPTQILFLSGLTLIIGPHKTFYFFARKQKLRGTICFFGGILLVFFKWPFVGIIVETFGFLNLFGYVHPPRALLPSRLRDRHSSLAHSAVHPLRHSYIPN